MKKIEYDKIGGRKFLLGTVCIVTEVVLLCTGYVSALIFKELFLVTLAIAVGGNLAQKIWKKEKNK